MKEKAGWQWSSTLFEYDTRFRIGAGEEFVHFDYNEPGAIPPRLEQAFDLLVGVLSGPGFLGVSFRSIGWELDC
jgi:hypothetical protein